MIKILSSQQTPATYYSLQGIKIKSVLIDIVGGKPSKIGDIIPYWFNTAWLTLLVKVDGHGLCATKPVYKLNRMKTYIDLSNRVNGISITPNGNIVDVYVSETGDN
jgi:hypothetical protein